MLRDIDNWYLEKPEPNRACLQALRSFILNSDGDITEAWKYRMPFFCFRGKMFCYLWLDKHTHQPYLGVVEGGRIDHPALVQGKRARMKILYIDAEQDIPVHTIEEILEKAKTFYK